MAKPRSLDAKLAHLRSLRRAPRTPELVNDLRAALGDKSNFIVAEAASIISQSHLNELAPDLVAAFDRFLEDAETTDKLCKAKIAITEALNQLDFDDEAFFWRGARLVQLEPVWGGSQDTAAPVRVACALSLVRTRAHGVLPYLVDLLCDPEKTARIGAAQALAYSETEAGYLLLRLKTRLGDNEPEVISECFSGMLKVKAEEAIPFVAGFLDSRASALQEAAILALGDSRRLAAWECLKAFWDKTVNADLRETILMGMALLRLAPANEFLLSLIAGGPPAVAEAAVSALALHRYDENIRSKTAEAVEKTGRAALKTHFAKSFHLSR